MIISVTAVAGAGSANIWLPIALKAGSRLKAVSAANLTTANQTVAIYKGPQRFIAITQSSAMPSDTLAECVGLEARSQSSLSDRITWSGDMKVDAWSNVIAGLFVNCTVNDRVQLSVEVEDDA